MAKTIVITLLVLLFTMGCMMSAIEYDSTPTSAPTATAKMTHTPLATDTVTVTGNVYKRDSEGAAHGWLAAGEVVQAVCDGEWCVLPDGLKFWRGCSSDNPDGLACMSER